MQEFQRICNKIKDARTSLVTKSIPTASRAHSFTNRLYQITGCRPAHLAQLALAPQNLQETPSREDIYFTPYSISQANQPWKVRSGESGRATPGPKREIRAISEFFVVHGNELHLKYWSHSPMQKAALVWICFSIRSVPCSLSAVLKLFLKMFFACGPGTILVQTAPEGRDSGNSTKNLQKSWEEYESVYTQINCGRPELLITACQNCYTNRLVVGDRFRYCWPLCGGCEMKLVQPGSFVIYNPMAIFCSIVQCEEHAPKSLCCTKFWPREFRGKFSSISDNWHCIPTCMLDFLRPARHTAKNCHRGWPVGMPVKPA